MLADSQRLVRFLHWLWVYVFNLSTPLASCSYATWISATIVPGKRKPWICVNFHWRHYTALQVTDMLAGSWRFVRILHRVRVYGFKLSIPLASCSYATWISATIVPGKVKPWICVNSYWRHYTALQVTDMLAGSWRFVRFLHRARVYGFKLSIPLASCSYATGISATIVPGKRKPWICVNSHWRHCMAPQVTDMLAGTQRLVRFMHRLWVYDFNLSTPLASCSYATWISATIVPGKGKPWICSNFHWRHYTALQVTDMLAGSQRLVRFLHRLWVYVFNLSTPLASSSYVALISAPIVPGRELDWISTDGIIRRCRWLIC